MDYSCNVLYGYLIRTGIIGETHQQEEVLTDSSYGSVPAEKDLDQDELLRLCREHLQRMKMSVEEINDIIKGTTDQAEDDSGEWFVLHQECVTASLVIKRQSSFVPLVIQKQIPPDSCHEVRP